jgi:ribosome biogenesis GTPase
MDKKQRRRLRSLLADLDTGERNRLTKRAAKMRKAALRTHKPGGRRLGLEDFLLELVGDELGGEPSGGGTAVAASSDEPSAVGTAGAAARGVVTGIAAGVCSVRPDYGSPDDDVQAALPPELAGRQQSELAVGDHVLLERRGDGHRVTAVLPRRSLLARADPHVARRRRAIAANVDLVVVAVAAQSPPLHPRLIDRYLVAVEHSGAQPVLVVNKMDLLDDRERHELLARLQPYRSLGMPVLPCSAGSGDGVAVVREALAGRTCVFVGQSGVGKSSLLNALGDGAAARTGAVRAGDGRGRHTTTASALYDLPGGVRVIDTPGIRRFSVEGGDAATIAAGFAEFEPYVAQCRFRDCTHLHEPGCAVRRAVADGAVPRSRYVSYRKLLGGDGDDPRTTDVGAAGNRRDGAEARPGKASRCSGGTGRRSGEAGDRPGRPGGAPGRRSAAPEPQGAHFACANCGRPVPLEVAGSEHRNHCPHCLHSVHLDEEPGDRAACCGAVMEPVTVWVRGRGEWALVHRCRACGRLSSNRIAGDDNEALLLSLAVRPLSAPPFPLDRLAGFGDRDGDAAGGGTQSGDASFGGGHASGAAAR